MFVNSLFSQYIYVSKYARYLDKEKRRETWPETVKRYFDFIQEFMNEKHNYDIKDIRVELETAVLKHEIMPSMRALMTAGKAAEKNHIAMYNCAYYPIEDFKAYDESMAISMSGTGDGFSVESHYVKQLPELPDQFFDSETTVVFHDSRLGWAKGYREFISLLLTGQVPRYDTSKLRDKGSRLKTMGGRCLTGDTIVYKDRKKTKGFNEVTIKELFDLQKQSPYRFNEIKLRSLDEDSGRLYRNQLVAVHSNGIKPVFEIITKNGYRIKATNNHRFMNALGNYEPLSSFMEGDLIAVNGSPERKTGTCCDCGTEVSRRAIRCLECNRISQFEEDCRDTTVRQRLEVQRYKDVHQKCELCGDVGDLECHHKDGNPWNDNENNLQVLCIPCHREEDMKRIHFGNAYSCKYMMYDEILTMKYYGDEETYDLEMKAPNHNFIANGFVSHNSSGPAPLIELLEFTIKMFKKASGRRLTTLEAHDLECKLGDIVVSGGVRRSAKISLSDLLDDKMRGAKSGNWYETAGYRRLSNNSAVYEEKPDAGVFMREWLALYESRSGERGIISRAAIRNVIKNSNEFRRAMGLPTIRFRDIEHLFGLNPCGEIILRPYQFCNLTSVQIYSEDTPETIQRKVRLATILGTFQACFTDFKYINKKWQRNCEDERLLGVSLNGIYGNKYTNGIFWNNIDHYVTDGSEFGNFLEGLKTEAIVTNIEWAKKLGINSATAITCVKPEGTTSQFCTIPSGIHPFHSPYYIRYVREDLKNPLCQFMIDNGFPFEKDAYDPANVMCFKFPVKTDLGVICKKDVTAIEHLELWKKYQVHYCEHKPSITVSIKEDEWLKVGAWVYDNFEWMSGVAFLPAEEGNMVYTQAPYTDTDEAGYEALLAKMPKEVDWSKLAEYELDDTTTNGQEPACMGQGGCAI